MSDWVAATDVEAAMRDALVAGDQELYFRILARTELLLPVSREVVAGRAPLGWGTWTTGNRTHVLAFTSHEAMRRCLSEPPGASRVAALQSLAVGWPNNDWWLAINPGLPIEAYLPSWFLAQLTRGEAYLGRPTAPSASPPPPVAPLASLPAAPSRAPSGYVSPGLGPTASGPAASGPVPSGAPPFRSAAHRLASSDLAAAISGRIRASQRSGSAPTSPPAEPTVYPSARRPDPRPFERTDHRDGSDRIAADQIAADQIAADRIAADRIAADRIVAPDRSDSGRPGSRRQGPEWPGSGGGPVAAGEAQIPERPDGSPGYVNAYGGVVETVEAEIIDSPPEPGTPAPGNVEPSRVPGYTSTSAGGSSGSAAAAFSAGRKAATAGRSSSDAPPWSGGPSASSGSGTSREAHASGGAPAPAGSGTPSAGRPSTGRPSAGRPVRETFDAEIVTPADTWAAGFVPANETEAGLFSAAGENNTDAFLSTLLLATIVVPVPPGTPASARPKDPDFPWEIEEADGARQIAVFTSPERLAEYAPYRPTDGATVTLRFVQIISAWPDESIGFAVNPGTPVGVTLPGSQIVALATWAADSGLRDERDTTVVAAAKKLESAPAAGVAGAPTAGAAGAITMQRTVPHAQVPFYLERGYDRVAGFVNRASEVAHLTMPRLLYRGLGLLHPGSPFSADDGEVHVLRWEAHRPDLYRLPYGGQTQAAMQAMQGWVIERSPFRGNGFAPGETDVVAEFKVDSVRLPHGAQMWRLTRDGAQSLVATFDADSLRWVRAEASEDA